MRYLWITSTVMIAFGFLLIGGYQRGTFATIAIIAGLLLVWSGVVKLIVLRIWRSSLGKPSVSEHHSQLNRPTSTARQHR
jgi:hypothetical protein